MAPIAQVVHDLIDILHGHGLSKARADELHDILNGAEEAAQGAGEVIGAVTAKPADTPAAGPKA